MDNSLNISCSKLEGSVEIPSSKSLGHRYLICGALGIGRSSILNVNNSEDISATIDIIRNIGAVVIEEKIDDRKSNYIIDGVGGIVDLKVDIFNACESGSTIRFLIPILLLGKNSFTITGEGKLKNRPQSVYYEIFKSKNIKFKHGEDDLPLNIVGELSSGIYKVKGNISSQFITGLLFALPLLSGDSVIEITTPLESKGYVDLTMDVLKKFKINIINENNMYKRFLIPGNQEYRNYSGKVEGDFSQVAFYAVGALIGGNKISCLGLNHKSLQGDKAILDIVKKVGGNYKLIPNGYEFMTGNLKKVVLDVSEFPDLLPALALLGSFLEGGMELINGERLKIKESNRLLSIATELNKLGANIEIIDDSLIIKEVDSFKGCLVDSWNDHRIAMTLGIASVKTDGNIILTRGEAVKKSYPDFWKDFISIGGDINGKY